MLIIGLAMALLQVFCIIWKPLQWLSFAESISGWIMRMSVMLLGILLILFGDELKAQH